MWLCPNLISVLEGKHMNRQERKDTPSFLYYKLPLRNLADLAVKKCGGIL
jgi:hypothetical protein